MTLLFQKIVKIFVIFQCFIAGSSPSKGGTPFKQITSPIIWGAAPRRPGKTYTVPRAFSMHHICPRAGHGCVFASIHVGVPTHNRRLSMGFSLALHVSASSLAFVPMNHLAYWPLMPWPWPCLAWLACVGAWVAGKACLMRNGIENGKSVSA